MDRRIAIFGDVHSNLEALEVVLADSRKQGATDYLCTGDVVGYNANPHECLEIVRSLKCPIVMGNHDFYVASKRRLDDFNPAAAAVVEWTREQLSQSEIEFLSDLPFFTTQLGITLVHSTLDAPESFGYVFDHLQAEAHFTHQVSPLCFHGHTHCPMIYEKQMGAVYRIDAQDFKLPMGRKYFINVGSVGQPRDGDARASYVIYDVQQRKVEFRRLEYDVAAAQAKVLKAGLPKRLSDRLALGQ